MSLVEILHENVKLQDQRERTFLSINQNYVIISRVYRNHMPDVSFERIFYTKTP